MQKESNYAGIENIDFQSGNIIIKEEGGEGEIINTNFKF